MRPGPLHPGWLAALGLLCSMPGFAATTVVLPMGAGPDTVVLTRPWAHRSVDVGIVMDVSGSMLGEMSNLKIGFNSTAIPQLQAAYPDTRFGVAEFSDWPCNGHGNPSYGDVPFRLLQRCTSNTPVIQTGINQLTVREGGDALDSGYDALHHAITGAGAVGTGCTVVPAFDNSFQFVAGVADGSGGGMGFRGGAATTVLAIVTDGLFHDAADYAFSGPVGRVALLAELQASGHRLAAVRSDPASAALKTMLAELSATSSTVTPVAHGSSSTSCETGISGAWVAPMNGGCPDVFDVATNGSGSGTALVGAIRNALDASPYTLTFATEGAAIPPAGLTTDLVEDIVFTGGANPAFAPAPTVSVDGASLLGSYASGSADIRVVLRNLTIPSSVDSVQRYPLYVETLANGVPVVRDTIIVEIPLLLSVPPGTQARGFRLVASGRNPFGDRFVARLALPESGPVRVVVCDAAGRRVRSLVADVLSAGSHALEWDGVTDDGNLAPAGIYFVRAAWRDERTSLRITRLR